jgi:hypothetical protein
MVLSVALVVFLGVGKVLDRSSDGSSDDAAEQAGASTLASPTATVPASGATKKGKGHKGKGHHGKGKGHKGNQGDETVAPPSPTPTPTPPPTPTLPDPTGPCADSDVYITPTIDSAVGGSDITIMLNLQTGTSPACTWHVSSGTVTMLITSGKDRIWRSTDCPDVIPAQDVVVRLASVTQVPVVWNARRSDEGCTNRTAWALPGTYHVKTAGLGGEPTDVRFEVVAPTAPTVTETAGPGGGEQGQGSNGQNANGQNANGQG